MTRYPAEVKAELLLLVTRTRERTGWTVRRILHHLGLSKARYRDWVQRAEADALADRRPIAPSRDSILGEERSAVLTYALANPKEGYRRLTWQMIDTDVACLRGSSVYRILGLTRFRGRLTRPSFRVEVAHENQQEGRTA